MSVRDVIIIGSGPAGLGAGVYAGRGGLSPLIISGMTEGGLITTTANIENYIGFDEPIGGIDLAEKMMNQAQRFNCEIEPDIVEKVEISTQPYKVITSTEEYETKTIVIATGSTPKKLQVKGESEFEGRGVSYCATCDGYFFKDKVVAVIGGGDSAGEEAIYLSNLAKKVYLVHRRDKLRASYHTQSRISQRANIEIVWNSIVKEVRGSEKVSEMLLYNRADDKEFSLACDGIFVSIGYDPQTELFRDFLELDKSGYIITHENVKTSKEGVFACGDVVSQKYKQAIVAAAMGAMAGMEVVEYLEMWYA